MTTGWSVSERPLRTTMTAREQLTELLDPPGVDAFFAEYFGRKPVILRNRKARVGEVMSLSGLVDAMVAGEQTTGRFLLRREHLTQGGADAIHAYLDEGHPVVWNSARGATPALDELTSNLAEAFAAHVWANVYATGTAGTPFDMHFDTHDVLAIQCEGAKEWWISQVRVDCPLDTAPLAPTIQRALAERSGEALEKMLVKIVAEPGDVLYIPRGQFHNARTPSGRSLHVTFAISPATGLDLLQALAVAALSEPLFREYLPLDQEDPTGTRTRAGLQRLADRLASLARVDDLTQLLAQVRRDFVAHAARAAAPPGLKGA